MITCPKPDAVIHSSRVEIAGWAWHGQPVNEVDISLDEGLTWQSAAVEERTGFSWQKFHLQIELEPGSHTLYARAATADGQMQPLTGRRNHCHSVRIVVSDRTSPD